MNFAKLSSFFRGLVVTALLLALTVGVVGGASHVVTDKYNTVDPDGYWTAEVAAKEHQQWSFDLAEPRDHNIRVAIVGPADASLSVSINSTELGSVSDQGNFTVGLEAGTHKVTVNNPGDVPVLYDLYLGTIADGTINIIKDTVPDAAQVFSFTDDIAGPNAFMLDDDGTQGNQMFINVPPDTFMVTETPVAGYSTTVLCMDDAANITFTGKVVIYAFFYFGGSLSRLEPAQ